MSPWHFGGRIKTLGLSPKGGKALLNIKENGVAAMDGNISGEDCDAIVSDFNKISVKGSTIFN